MIGIRRIGCSLPSVFNAFSSCACTDVYAGYFRFRILLIQSNAGIGFLFVFVCRSAVYTIFLLLQSSESIDFDIDRAFGFNLCKLSKVICSVCGTNCLTFFHITLSIPLAYFYYFTFSNHFSVWKRNLRRILACRLIVISGIDIVFLALLSQSVTLAVTTDACHLHSFAIMLFF